MKVLLVYPHFLEALVLIVENVIAVTL